MAAPELVAVPAARVQIAPRCFVFASVAVASPAKFPFCFSELHPCVLRPQLGEGGVVFSATVRQPRLVPVCWCPGA